MKLGMELILDMRNPMVGSKLTLKAIKRPKRSLNNKFKSASYPHNKQWKFFSQGAMQVPITTSNGSSSHKEQCKFFSQGVNPGVITPHYIIP